MKLFLREAIDSYERAFEHRIVKLTDFANRNKPFLVHVNGPCSFYTAGKSIEKSFQNNLSDFVKTLEYLSDTLPYIEPWFGTGVYAQAFGGVYFWRENECPACHYKYKDINEIKNINKPSIAESEMLQHVKKSLEYICEQTAGRIPICMTDTQSPNDVATLILDAVEVFTAFYMDPDAIKYFLQMITDIVEEFSLLQKNIIGKALASPGHIMANSSIYGKGISISDDNLAVCSQKTNEEFLLPYDIQLGQKFGGVAIHSCGNWAHTMPIIVQSPDVFMIDCAISLDADPNPNTPEAVRDIFRGTDKIVQARIGSDVHAGVELIRRIWAKDLRLIVSIQGIDNKTNEQYQIINSTLERLYK